MVQNIAQRRSANSFATTYSSNFASSLLITANDVDANGKCRRKGVVIWSCSSRAGYFLIVVLALSLLFMILALILSVLGISSTSTTPSYNYSNRNVYYYEKKRRGNLNNPGFIDSFENNAITSSMKNSLALTVIRNNVIILVMMSRKSWARPIIKYNDKYLDLSLE
mmetsp:Transcript_29463/g.61357  ORF Transcript_29463/g.61357 Transcript_29463/m.61357 type:complete len:166 (-) Transcript_29463:720-1217(-)